MRLIKFQSGNSGEEKIMVQQYRLSSVCVSRLYKVYRVWVTSKQGSRRCKYEKGCFILGIQAQCLSRCRERIFEVIEIDLVLQSSLKNPLFCFGLVKRRARQVEIHNMRFNKNGMSIR